MKVGVVDVYVRVSSHLKEELAWAVEIGAQKFNTFKKPALTPIITHPRQGGRLNRKSSSLATRDYALATLI